ncbi:MAG: PAS domain-containing protein [Bacteroidales bacterium]|nr:PAS domain-containing protein [Bacteroidales bacterium]
MEISSLKEITDFEISFVEKLAESITSQLFTTKITMKTQYLLLQSQQQAEELRAQEEEARQNIEEMQANREEAMRLKSDAMGYLNTVNHSIIRADFSLDGNLEYANTRFLDFFKYKSKEAYSMHVSEFFPDENRDEFMNLWNALLNGGKHIEQKFIHKTKEGTIELLSTYSTVKDLHGTIQKILYLGLDVTMQNANNFDSLEFQAVDKCIIRVELDNKGSIVDVNDMFLSTYGFTKDDIHEVNFEALFSKEDKKEFEKAWQQVNNGQNYETQIKRTLPDGAEKWFHVNYIPHLLTTNELFKVTFIGTDITENKILELQMQKRISEFSLRENELIKKIGDLENQLSKK